VITVCEMLVVSRGQQETQLSLTNRATHLCNVADLTSVIKIHLKNDSSYPAFQGHSKLLEPSNRHGSIRHLWFPISVL